MKLTSTIRLLTTSTNKKGDLFTRLMGDLFYALGYEDIRYDVHSSGHEIDIQGEHRHEFRMVMAECKAHKAAMGGDEVNKFRGALVVEREKVRKPLTGYFISLGGYTESAIEQERSLREEHRVILLNARRIIQELEKSRVLLSDAEATEKAGQCAQFAGLKGAGIDEIELLAHEDGYVKAVIYKQNEERTHVALIHAGGAPLAEGPARAVIQADEACGGLLHTLQYLPPAPVAPDRQQLKQHATEAYHRWINDECGFIHLDGLPTDQELSPKRLKLERLFVPLRAIVIDEQGQADKQPEPDRRPIDIDEAVHFAEAAEQQDIPIRSLLKNGAHLALLAAPGGGKSTLLKRLATAYAFEERRSETADHLPAHNWMPLFLRCRELRDRADQPILRIIEGIPGQLSMPPALSDAFHEVVNDKLQAGHVLLLVDGLDEIADEAARKSFANNLRTFLAVYPQVALVVTSREAGFRAVAGVIASTCQHARLAPLNEADIRYLCEQWHVEVFNDSAQVRAQASKLADDICDNPSIFVLAQNPLLLTTLLVVKRYIGELPRNRAALYGEAVKLLVKTWNVEGFGTINDHEALAQLSFVACAMMERGIKQIPHSELLDLLRKAREVMQAELHYAKVAPEEFIVEIERRSSLLMLVGQRKIEGELVPIYEFRHLTFQEYLAARGYVKEQHPRRNEELPLVDLLAPHFEDEGWREVIPVAAVLAGRKAEASIKYLIEACKAIVNDDRSANHSNPYLMALAQCIADEVIILPDTLTAALVELGRFGNELETMGKLALLRQGRAGEQFQLIVEQKIANAVPAWEEYGAALRKLTLYELKYTMDYHGPDTLHVLDELSEYIGSNDRITQIKGALGLMTVCFDWFTPLMWGAGPVEDIPVLPAEQAQRLRDGLDAMLETDDLPAIYAASWGLAWSNEIGVLNSAPGNINTVAKLLHHWYTISNSLHAHHELTARFASWALREQPLLDRNALLATGINVDQYVEFIQEQIDGYFEGNAVAADTIEKAALTVGWYLQAPWNDEQLAKHIGNIYKSSESPRYGSSPLSKRDLAYSAELLRSLGEAGEKVLAERTQRIDDMQKKPVRKVQSKPV